jgi:hypothetical protein
MATRNGRPAHSLLKPTGADALRSALERLRGNGLSDSEAAAEMLRRNFYDFIDSEIEPQSSKCSRLRIVKR